MSAEEIRQRGIDAVRALNGREIFPLIGELLEFRDETGRRLASMCEAEGIGPYDDALYGIGMEMIRRRECLAEIEAACFAVCKDNTREVLGDAPYEDAGRFVCLNEDGDPIIDADTVAEVVEQMSRAWERTSESCVKQQDENRELRRQIIAHEKRIAALDSQGRRALQVIVRAWCDEGGHPREGEGIPAGVVQRVTDILMGIDAAESKQGVRE